MSDNIILLSTLTKTELKRTIRVVKTRASGHDGSLHELQIGPDGMVVA